MAATKRPLRRRLPNGYGIAWSKTITGENFRDAHCVSADGGFEGGDSAGYLYQDWGGSQRRGLAGEGDWRFRARRADHLRLHDDFWFLEQGEQSIRAYAGFRCFSGSAVACVYG